MKSVVFTPFLAGSPNQKKVRSPVGAQPARAPAPSPDVRGGQARGTGPAALTPCHGQPSHLYSPTTVLKYQRGNCFDFSTLLCSMLIGAGYDAYCINGYGSQDLCLVDLTREVCPLTAKPKKVGWAPDAPPESSVSLLLPCPGHRNQLHHQSSHLRPPVISLTSAS